MDKNQAISLLIQAAQLAQKAGVFSLKDASMVLKAIETLQVPVSEVKATTELAKEETVASTENA